MRVHVYNTTTTPTKKKFTGHFPQMKPVISGFFAERDLQHEGNLSFSANEPLMTRSICGKRPVFARLICGKRPLDSFAEKHCQIPGLIFGKRPLFAGLICVKRPLVTGLICGKILPISGLICGKRPARYGLCECVVSKEM